MSVAPLLELDTVAISYHGAGGVNRVVHDVSFRIDPGEVVALVGESGSGKTTTAQAIIGLLGTGGALDHGAIRLNGTDIAGWPQSRLDGIRGSKISLIPQDPGSSLNPVKSVGRQVGEILRIHRRGDRRTIQARVIALLGRVGLSNPALRARQYPHELSGGMRQRVLIAIAVALQPALIIADEPTSALDVTVQKRILDLIDVLRHEFGTAVLLVTHDLGVAADRADRLIVLQHGRVQEQGRTADILAAPQSRYTRQLLSDAPSLSTARLRPPRLISQSAEPAILAEGLVQDFTLGGARRSQFRAIDNISFAVPRGTTHAIVGESGSGKTTTIRQIMGFQKPTAGRVWIEGIDMTTLKGEALRQVRKTIQLVYQNPFGSLDPRQTVSEIIGEPLLNYERIAGSEKIKQIQAMLDRVGLDRSLLSRRPRELSGGQRQRVAIARALVLKPRILVLDEAVSALDVTVQAQILNLLQKLQTELGLTYLFVSHDLAVVRLIADTVSVLQEGRQVDSGTVEEVFVHSHHPYTRQLIEAIPGQRRAA